MKSTSDGANWVGEFIDRQVRAAREKYFANQHLESASGVGSTLRATEEIREFLPHIVHKYGIQILNDIPCGDWNWMRCVDLGGVQYRGFDIVPELIERNRQLYARDNIQFYLFNAITDIPPYADLILCRDFLFHLPLDLAEVVLHNFRASGSPLCLLTTFPWIQENHDFTEEEKMRGWGWKPYNMSIEPFNLGEPLEHVVETRCQGRWVALYRL